MELTTLVGTAIRNKLLANVGLASLTTSINQFTVPGTVEMPYVTFSWSAGGMLNNTPKDAFDVEFLITAVGRTQPEARSMSDMIEYILHRQDIDYPDGWANWAKVNLKMPFMDLLNLQNTQFWRVGGFYRFRGIKE